MTKTKIEIAIVIVFAFSTNANAANVWKCKRNGQIEFSQTPCIGVEAQQQHQVKVIPQSGIAKDLKTGQKYKLREPNIIMDQGEKYRVHGENWGNQQNSNTGTPENYHNDQEASTSNPCVDYQLELEKINRIMRSGYSSQQGEKLRRDRRMYEDMLDRYCN